MLNPTRRISSLVTGLLALLVVGCLATGGCRLFKREKPTIRLYDGQWDSLRLNNAIARFIIEQGYGYPVATVTKTSYLMRTALEQGKIDANLDARRQIWIDWYTEQVRAGTILSVGVLYEGGTQFFIIPKYVAEQHEIETIFDMRRHWQLFRDPDDPSKGLFYNGIIGWGGNEINEIKLEAYGLTTHYNSVSPGSPAALEAALRRAQEHHAPIFAHCLSPNALLGAYEWHILKEPPYSEECWGHILAALSNEGLRPLDHACAYEGSPVEKIIHVGMLKKAPDIVEVLKRMRMDPDILSELLAWEKRYHVWNPEITAVHFLRRHERRWRDWVTIPAYWRIRNALKQAPGDEPVIME